MQRVKIKGIKPTTVQRELISAIRSGKYKYICAAWSRQIGKSVTMQLMCIEWLLNKREEIIYFTPTYNLAKNFFGKIIKMLPQGLVAKSNSSDLVIETITGSKLRFFSGEAAQTARGSNCTRLIIDEAAYIKEEIDGQSFWYNIVVPLLKARGKTAILISTPFGKQGFFYELCMRGLKGEPNYYYTNHSIYDDDLITKEEIEELKKNYPPLAWKCEFECQFLSNALSVFPDYEDCFVDDFKFNRNSNIYCGVDLSTVGSDNTVVTFVNQQQQVIQYIIEGTLEEKYAKIASLINKYRPKGGYVESNSIGVVMYEEIRKMLKNKHCISLYATTNQSKKDYISLISVAITNREITFDKENKTLYSEMGTFTYKLTKNGLITYAAQAPNHDDTVISLGLALAAKESFANPITTKNFGFIDVDLKSYDLR